jgi:WD40 repeat protein
MTFAVTADGQVIAFRLPREPIIRIRSADAEWRETGRLEGLRAQSEAMTINSARSELAIALKDGYVQTYEMHLSDAHRSMPPGVGPICSELVHAGPCVSISYVDDHWTATAGEDGFVRGYNPTGTSLAPLTTVDCEAVDCVLSPDGRQICVVDTTAGLRIYTQDESLQTWSHAADLTDVLSESGMPHVPSSIWHQAFADDEGSDEHWIAQSSDGRRVAVATDSNRIAVFDVQARHHLVSFEVGEEDSDRYEWFKSLALSADGKFLASACSDRVLRVWSVDQGELICEREYTNSVEAVCFSPNSQQLVVGGRFEQMEVLSVPEAGLSWSAVAGGGTYCVGFLPEGDQFVTGHGDGTVRVWAIGGGSASAVYHGHASAVSAVTIGDDGQTAISIDERGDVRLWNLRGGQPVGRLFERRKSGLRFHRLLLPEDQSHCLAVVSSQRGQRQLRLIDLRP